jgi:hypothetical protein
MAKTHQLLEDVYIGVDDYTAEEDDIKMGIFGDVVAEFGDFNNGVLAMRTRFFRDGNFFAYESFGIEAIMDGLLLDE